MRYAKIRNMDIANGPGVRVSLWVQGCPIHCEGCQNKEIWDFEGGNEYTRDESIKILALCKPAYIDGISILGGEPLVDISTITVLSALFESFKKNYPTKTIWLWTGYTLEQLLDKYHDTIGFKDFLKLYIDVLVDGPWKKDLYDPKLKYRGSSNQRVIDIKKTLEKGEVVLYE